MHLEAELLFGENLKFDDLEEIKSYLIILIIFSQVIKQLIKKFSRNKHSESNNNIAWDSHYYIGLGAESMGIGPLVVILTTLYIIQLLSDITAIEASFSFLY